MITDINLEGIKRSKVVHIHQHRTYYFLKYLLENELSNKQCSSVCLEPMGSVVYRKQEICLNCVDKILPDTRDMLTKCRKRFIFLILTFVPKENAGGKHANLLVIDNKTKKYERYETYGYDENDEDLKHKEVEKQLLSTIGKIMKGYKLVPFCKTNLEVGIQEKISRLDIDDDKKGVCVPLSCFMMHMKILNPDISIKDLQTYLLKKGIREVYDMLLRYVTLIYMYTPDSRRVKVIEKELKGKLSPELIYKIIQFETVIPNLKPYTGE